MGDAAASAAAARQTPSDMDVLKKTLRAQVATALRAAELAELTLQSQRVAQRVAALPEFATAKALSVYLHMPREAETSQILASAFEAGKKVYVPKILGRTADDLKMVHALSAQDIASFPKDKWKIPDPPLVEPDETPRADAIDSLDLDVVVLPGVAFDRTGGRLGHGKAYYDCFLRRLEEFYEDNRRPMPTLIGICLAPQLIESVPIDDHDRLMDIVVTPDEVIRPQRQ